MNVIIKGMEMPLNCFDCPIFDNFCQERCGVTGTLVYGEIDPQMETLPDCPLVPLPAGHGRIVDASVAEKKIKEMYMTMVNSHVEGSTEVALGLHLAASIIRTDTNVPTIVLSEGGGEE